MYNEAIMVLKKTLKTANFKGYVSVDMYADVAVLYPIQLLNPLLQMCGSYRAEIPAYTYLSFYKHFILQTIFIS